MKPSVVHSFSPWDAASVAESLSVMTHKEQTVYRSSDYLYLRNSLSLHGIDEKDRTKMVDWCYSFIDVCQFQRETVAVAIEMVDRFLSKSSQASDAVLCDHIQFQLLTVTALYVAIKTIEPTVIGIDFLSTVSCELYSEKSIEAMERTLLNALSWRISPPTFMQVAHHILVLYSKQLFLDEFWSAILEEVGYQVENAVRDYFFVTRRRSTVAVAAIANAIDQLNKRNSQALIRSLLSSINMNDEFESLEAILVTKKRLYSLVYGQEEVDAAGLVEDKIAVSAQ